MGETQGRDETNRYQKKRRTYACWSEEALGANEGPLGSKTKDRRDEASTFSKERWTHSCRTKKAVAVDEGSLGGATESFGAQVVDLYNRNPQLADSLRLQIGRWGLGTARERTRTSTGFPIRS